MLWNCLFHFTHEKGWLTHTYTNTQYLYKQYRQKKDWSWAPQHDPFAGLLNNNGSTIMVNYCYYYRSVRLHLSVIFFAQFCHPLLAEKHQVNEIGKMLWLMGITNLNKKSLLLYIIYPHYIYYFYINFYCCRKKEKEGFILKRSKTFSITKIKLNYLLLLL